MAPRLKVFAWSDGFHTFTVAASSRPKALEAWGASQDLFKSGLASEVDEGPEREAALATPGEVIRSNVAVDPGQVEKAPRRTETAAAKKARARKLDLRGQLEALETETADKVAQLQAERDEIERNIAESQRQAAGKRESLKRALSKL
jgi:hypothetical protein